MIEKLHRKFIIISVCSVFTVIVVIAASINISNYLQIVNNANEILDLLIDNDGHFPKSERPDDKIGLPPKMSPETPFSTRFFTVVTDNSGDIVSVDTSKIAVITSSQAREYAEKVLSKMKTKGIMKNYLYRVSQKDYGTLLVFVDCNREIEMFHSFLLNSSYICFAGIAAVFILILIFSKKAIAPVSESYEKQKQFITDASHELKTPLAIIGANTEVLEIEFGESEWTISIQNQVERLSQLVSNLLSLTRMDEEKGRFEITDFSLSDAVLESVDAFISLCNSQGKFYNLDIEKNLSYCGNEKAIRQLISILLDNAIKYAKQNSEIKLSLKKQGKKYLIAVSNEADNLKQGNLDIIFERFYRSDSSRNSQTGGYGIGLSIAKAIVLKHNGKISAISPDGNIIIIKALL